MMRLGAGVLLLLTLWAFQAPATTDWVLEDTKWLAPSSLGLSVFSPRGLTAWTWQWVNTPADARILGLLLHITVSGLSALLAYLLGLSLLGTGLVAVLLLLHPLAVESVTYAASRSELIAALGVVSGCLLTVTMRSWRRWPLISLCLLVAVLGKESGIVLLGLVPLLLYATGQPWLTSALTAYFIAGISVVGYYGGGLDIIAHRGDMAGEIKVLDWMQMQSLGVWHMVYVTVTTAGMTPDVDYDRLSTTARLVSLWSLGLVCLAAAWFSVARRNPITIGVLFMAIAVAPRFVVQTPTGYLNEHQFYTPRIGLFIALAGGVVYLGDLLARGRAHGQAYQGAYRTHAARSDARLGGHLGGAVDVGPTPAAASAGGAGSSDAARSGGVSAAASGCRPASSTTQVA